MPNALDVIAWQEGIKQRGLSLLGQKPEGPLSLEEARLVRDACMLCAFMMHSSLAQRAEVVISAKASAYAHIPCQREGCPAARSGNCRGVRYEQDSTGGWRLVVPHWKTSSSNPQVGPVLEITDQGELSLLEGYERLARPCLLLPGTEPEPMAMYLTMNGSPFEQTSICRWFKDCHR